MNWPEVLMLVLGRYMLVVCSPDGCIKIRPANIFKMAAIQNGRQNFEIYKTECKTYLSSV